MAIANAATARGFHPATVGVGLLTREKIVEEELLPPDDPVVGSDAAQRAHEARVSQKAR